MRVKIKCETRGTLRFLTFFSKSKNTTFTFLVVAHVFSNTA